MMDNLIEAIVKILVERQKNSLVVSCEDFDEKLRTTKDFLYHQTIHLKQVGAIQLAKLSKLDAEDAVTVWMTKGLEYDCEFILHLGFSAVCLIPTALYEWPITIETNEGKRIRVCSNKIITYSDVALLTEQDILVRFRHQKITDLAKEFVEKNKIQQIVRT